MDFEKIEDTSSHGTPVASKSTRKGKKKKVDAVISPSNALTRFLGPPARPSISTWEDVNRQCPVCQKRGFSSQALSLHVNLCLDTARANLRGDGEGGHVGSSARGGAAQLAEIQSRETRSDTGTAAGRARSPASAGRAAGELARDRSADSSDWGVRREKDSPNADSGGGCDADIVRSKAAEKSRSLKAGVCVRFSPPQAGKKRTKGQTAAKGCVERSGSTGTKGALQRSKKKTHQSPVSLSSKPSAGFAVQRVTQTPTQSATQGTQGRRRGRLLARPRQHTVGDKKPAAVAPAKSSRVTSARERARDDLATEQLLYVLRASEAAESGNDAGWLNTALFPKNDMSGDCVRRESNDGCNGRDSQDESADELESCSNRFRCNRSSGVERTCRVRPRPASWGGEASVRSGCGGREWFGMWPDGINEEDDCWGDGDGYLTLQPFPSRETVSRWESQADENRNDDSSGGGSFSIARPTAVRRELSAKSSVADRFLDVFNQLQPARRAFNLPDFVMFPMNDVSKSGNTQCLASGAGGSKANVKRQPVMDETADRGKCDTKMVGLSKATPGKGEQQSTCASIPSPPVSKSRRVVPGASSASSIQSSRNSQERTKAVEQSSRVGVREGVQEGDTSALPRRQTPSISGCGGSNGRSLRQFLGPQSSGKSLESPKLTTPSSVDRDSRELTAKSRDAVIESAAIDLTLDATPPKLGHSPRKSFTVGSAPTVTAADGRVAAIAKDSTNGTAVKENARPVEAFTSVPGTGAENAREVFFDPGAVQQSTVATQLPRSASVSINARATSGGPFMGKSIDDTIGRKESSNDSGDTRPRAPSATASSLSHAEACKAGVAVNSTKYENTSSGCKTSRQSSSDGLKRQRFPRTVTGSQRRGDGGGLSYAAVCEAAGVVPKPSVGRETHTKAETAGPCANIRDSPSKRATAAHYRTVPSCSSGVVRSTSIPDDIRSTRGHEGTGIPVALSAEGNAPLDGGGGRRADVPQKGLLRVVDPERGATLRSSWDIDESEELGRLVHGNTLNYDAVWYLPPPDEECIGVIRYRVVPHCLLAPKVEEPRIIVCLLAFSPTTLIPSVHATRRADSNEQGGWISERGRFASDPYIIVEASPTASPRKPSAVGGVNSAAAGAAGQYAEDGVTADGTVGRDIVTSFVVPSDFQRRENHSFSPSRKILSSGRKRKGQPSSPSSTPGGSQETQRGIQRNTVAPRTIVPVSSQGERKGGRSMTTMTNRSRNGPQQPSSDVVTAHSWRPGISSVRRASASELGSNESDDRFRCPGCNRGMDHWKAGQRQQHVHACLLRQPPSTKKQVASAAPTSLRLTPSTSCLYPSGDHSSRDLAMPTTQLSTVERQRLGGKGEVRWVAEPMEGPRSARVSLQGVFSPPKEAGRNAQRQPPARRRGSTSPPRPSLKSDFGSNHAKRADMNSSRQQVARTNESLFARETTAKPPATAGNRRDSFNRSSKDGKTGSKGPPECPVCKFSFAIALGQWEVQAHIQRCLECLDGMFDAEE